MRQEVIRLAMGSPPIQIIDSGEMIHKGFLYHFRHQNHRLHMGRGNSIDVRLPLIVLGNKSIDRSGPG